MAVVFTLVAAGQNYACDGLVDQLNNGKIKIKDADGTLLVTLTFGATAFGSAGASVDGRAAANAITDGTAVATGTATQATIHKSDDTQVATCNVATSGAAINLDSLSIVTGQVYGLASMNIRMPTECGA